MDTADRLQLEMQLRQARRDEIERRVTAHNVEVQRNRSGSERRTARGLARRRTPLDFLAIGDSWFEYPLTDDGFITGFNQAIVGEAGTQLRSMGTPPPTILSYALHGLSTIGNADL
jgi:hypothetical protein